MKNNKLWFKAKMYGWGWYPVSWQGWAVTLLYVTPIVQFAMLSEKYANSPSDFFASFALPFIIDTIFLLIICYAKGERPHWRWGGK